MIDNNSLDTIIVKTLADKYGIDIGTQDKKVENFLNRIGPLLDENVELRKVIKIHQSKRIEAENALKEKAHNLKHAEEIIIRLLVTPTVPKSIKEAVKIVIQMLGVEIKYNNDKLYLIYPDKT